MDPRVLCISAFGCVLIDDYSKNLPSQPSPRYSLYQREIFLKGQQEGIFPPISCDPATLQQQAEEKFSQGGKWYSKSNAGISWTDHANREAFYKWKILPRMLVDTRVRDMTVEIFGHKLPNPFLFAPVGINQIYHEQGELIPARVAGELGMGYCLSTASSTSIEDVAQANGKGNPRFFQLYMPPEDEITISLLTRAFKNGFDVCILCDAPTFNGLCSALSRTLDTWQLAWRPTDIDRGNYAFYRGVGNAMGLSDPAFMKLHGDEIKKDPTRWIDTSVWHGRAHTWEKAQWAREQWRKISGGRPFVLKGIQTVEDAKKAAELGFEGIVVSNHAGRQVDGAVASLDVLPGIVDAVGDSMTVLFDSGIRTGSDAFKALALGAKAVLFGRIWIWGMSAGYAGCAHVTKALLADLDILMTVAGFPDIKKISRADLKPPHL